MGYKKELLINCLLLCLIDIKNLEFIYKFIVHELPPPFEDSLYKQRES